MAGATGGGAASEADCIGGGSGLESGAPLGEIIGPLVEAIEPGGGGRSLREMALDGGIAVAAGRRGGIGCVLLSPMMSRWFSVEPVKKGLWKRVASALHAAVSPASSDTAAACAIARDRNAETRLRIAQLAITQLDFGIASKHR
jgi:hypothetical protein